MSTNKIVDDKDAAPIAEEQELERGEVKGQEEAEEEEFLVPRKEGPGARNHSTISLLVFVLTLVFVVVWGSSSAHRNDLLPSLLARWQPSDGPLSSIDPASNIRLNDLRNYLVEQEITTQEKLDSADSVQARATRFLALEDELQVNVPSKGSTDDDEAYEFLTRYVLTVLYFATNGDKWERQLEFLSKQHHCSWYEVLRHSDMSTEYKGLACDQNASKDQDRKKITSLFVGNNTLQGQLPEELGLLTTLINLDFNVNSLSGSIPSSLQAMTTLENFFISENRFSGLIPYWIASWTALRNINLSHNAFTGNIPSTLARMEHLNGVAFSYNQLIGEIPAINKLEKLEQFYVDHNQLTGPLVDSFRIDALQFLDVSHNQFSGGVPVHFFSMPNLLVLNLNTNNFSTLPFLTKENTKLTLLALQNCKFDSQPIPSSISNLKSLETLDASQNQFTGSIPTSLGGLTNMTSLFLAENSFDNAELPNWLARLTALEELSLKSTGLTGSIPNFVGASLPKLALLDLDHNDLIGAIPGLLGSRAALRFLLLNRNKLVGTIPQPLLESKELELLYLEGNDNLSMDSMDSTESICDSPIAKKHLVIECSLCPCCDLCCSQDDKDKVNECNDNLTVPDYDPIWQDGFRRSNFTFGPSASFPSSKGNVKAQVNAKAKADDDDDDDSDSEDHQGLSLGSPDVADPDKDKEEETQEDKMEDAPPSS